MSKLTFQKNTILGIVKGVKTFNSALSVQLAVANQNKKGYDTIPIMVFGQCIDQFANSQIGDMVYVEGRLHINHNKNTGAFNLELVSEKIIATGDRCSEEEFAVITAKKGGYAANGAGNGGQLRQYKQYQPKNTANGGGQTRQPQGYGNGNSSYNQPQSGNGYGSQPRQPRQYGYGTQPQGGNGYNQPQSGYYSQPQPQGNYYQPYGGNSQPQPQGNASQPSYGNTDQKGGSFPEYNGNFSDVYYDIPDDDQ